MFSGQAKIYIGTSGWSYPRGEGTWSGFFYPTKKINELERWFALQDNQIRVLEKERQKFSSIVHQTDAGFLSLDSSLQVTWFNTEFTKRFGSNIKIEDLHGQKCHRVLCGNEKICDKCPTEKSLKKGTVVHHEISLEINGNIRQIYVTAIPIKSPEGKIDEIMVMLQDISELEILLKSQRELEKINKELKESEKKISEQRDQLIRANLQLEKANESLQRLATVDGLTGIANYRKFEEFFNSEWKRAIRNKKPISLIMIDLDFFKPYNDTYGHQLGDDCLKKVASVLDKLVNRPTDIVARYGGEEFVIVLSETDLNGCTLIAERVRMEVESLGILHKKSSISKYVTISAGCSTSIPNKDEDPTSLIRLADDALYRSKKKGRNCITTVGY